MQGVLAKARHLRRREAGFSCRTASKRHRHIVHSSSYWYSYSRRQIASLWIAEHAQMQAKVVAVDRMGGFLCLASSSRRRPASHVASGWACIVHLLNTAAALRAAAANSHSRQREISLVNELSMRGGRRRRWLGAAGAAARARSAVLREPADRAVSGRPALSATRGGLPSVPVFA